MTRFPWRSKVAAVVILFVLGTFAGQIQHLLDSVRGKVEDGARITGELRNTVTTIDRASDALRAQVADLQAKLAAGTATPDQVSRLEGLVSSLKGVAGPSGTPGAQGRTGEVGPPGRAVADPPATTTTSTTGPGGSTSTTRPAPASTTTTTRPAPTTTTTRCTVGVGRLVKIGC